MVSKNEILKKLLKENVEELNTKTYIDDLTISFENNNYYVYYKNDIILEGEISKINVDFKSQKEFVLDIANKIYEFAKDYNELDYKFFRYLIRIDNEYFFDVFGKGDIFQKHFIDLNIELEKWNERFEIIDYYKNIIKNLLDENKHRVVLYTDYYGFITDFYIDGRIYKNEINIAYIENPKNVDKIDDNLIKYKSLTLYYKLNAYKEIEKIIKSIL